MFSSKLTTGARQGAGKNKNKISARKTTKFKTRSGRNETKPKNVIVDQEVQAVGVIYRHFKRCSGGADGGVVGTNGSIRAACLVRMLRALKIKGREIVDFGAGDGRVLHAAMAAGATNANGYELPANKAHKFVFDAVRKKLHSDTTGALSTCRVSWSKANWFPLDIDRIRQMPGNPQCVYTFWVGMPFKTQEHILTLCAQSPTVRAIAVFRDRKWPKPEDGPLHPSPTLYTFALPLIRPSLSVPLLLHFSMLPNCIFCTYSIAKTGELAPPVLRPSLLTFTAATLRTLFASSARSNSLTHTRDPYHHPHS